MVDGVRGDGRQIEALPLAPLPSAVPALRGYAPDVAVVFMNLLRSELEEGCVKASSLVFQIKITKKSPIITKHQKNIMLIIIIIIIIVIIIMLIIIIIIMIIIITIIIIMFIMITESLY